MKRVLVANRGEIALRIIRACRERGVESVAVYSEADATAPHVRAADRTIAIGPAPAPESYLRIDRLIEAAKETGADSIHPGYGFLSENAAFAEACERAGITFIGPPAAAIRLMGSKIAAREAMQAAGVPVVPGETPHDQSDAGVLAAATAIGFPAVIKAAAGGGGKGMRIAASAAEAPELIGAARREAQAAFGDGTLYVERLIARPRHIEIQVLADAHGHVVHLFERECSAQRRHQKVIEESPSPALSERVRQAMGAAAIAAARAAGYRNAGTVEFLLEGDGDAARFYFLEMNTRLQVEHPVTEAVTGRDLVHAQLTVASGEPLPWSQDDLTRRGHAIECRIYAEDPSQGFLPQAGRLLVYREPRGPGVRVDAGVVEGSSITVHYDPMIAKLIVHADSRPAAIERARAALQQFAILGVRTNIAFLLKLLDDREFREGRLHTRSIDERLPELLPEAAEPPSFVEGGQPHFPTAVPDPWQTLRGWRPEKGGQPHLSVAVPFFDHEYLVTDDGGKQHRVVSVVDGDTRWVFCEGAVWQLPTDSAARPRTRAAAHHENLSAPMPATVLKVPVAQGDNVTKGQTVVLLEAMKMELPLRAAHAGKVTAIRCREGEIVQPGVTLVEIE